MVSIIVNLKAYEEKLAGGLRNCFWDIDLFMGMIWGAAYLFESWHPEYKQVDQTVITNKKRNLDEFKVVQKNDSY